MSVKTNLENLLGKLENTSCKLIAVTKTHPVTKLFEAYNTGFKRFGENKVQELVDKYEQMPKDIEWHMIGHLQSNKVKYIVPFVHLIHSVDSLSLLKEINKQAVKINRPVNCLLQVFIADEDTKFGFDEAELVEALKAKVFEEFTHVNIVGLMGMATNTDDRDKIGAEFRKLKAVFDQIAVNFTGGNICMQELSMGMSSDYDLAIEAGSTYIRVGSAIFGYR